MTNSISELMAYSAEDVQAVRNVIAPKAPDEIIRLVLFRCKQLGADPMGKAIYAINRPNKVEGAKAPSCPKCSKPLRKSKDGGWYCWKQADGCGLNISDDHPAVAGVGELTEDNWVLQCSVDFFRSQAESSGDYAGQDGPYWCGADGLWKDVWTSKEKPFAARVGILRKSFAQTLWSTVLMSEYDQLKNLWKTRYVSMLAKCGEVAGLRRAFPEKLHNLYVAEEFREDVDIEGESTEVKREQIQLPPGLVALGASVGMMPLGIQRDLEKIGNIEALEAQYTERAAKMPHRAQATIPVTPTVSSPPPQASAAEREAETLLDEISQPKPTGPMPSLKAAIAKARMAFDKDAAKALYPMRDDRLKFASWAIGRAIASFTDFNNADEAEVVIRALNQELAKAAPSAPVNTQQTTCPCCGAMPGVAHFGGCELA
jgi:RecT family